MCASFALGSVDASLVWWCDLACSVEVDYLPASKVAASESDIFGAFLLDKWHIAS